MFALCGKRMWVVVTAISATVGASLALGVALPVTALGATGQTVSGVVRDPTGNRVAGVSVCIDYPAHCAVRDNMVSPTAADGTYTIPGVPAGSHGLRISGWDYPVPGGTYSFDTALTVDDDTLIDIALPTTVRLTVRVVDQAGAPVAGLTLSARGQSTYAPFAGAVANGVVATAAHQTDDSGAWTARIPASTEGSFFGYLSHQSSDYINLNSYGHDFSADTIIELGATRIPRHSFSGTVRGADGAPLANALVCLDRPTYCAAYDNLVGPTGADGRFVIRDVPAGQHGLRVIGWGYPSDGGSYDFAATVELDADRDVDLTLPAGVEVRARVVDEFGTPVEHYSVYARSEVTPFEILPGVVGTGVAGTSVHGTDADGRWHDLTVAGTGQVGGYYPSSPAAYGGTVVHGVAFGEGGETALTVPLLLRPTRVSLSVSPGAPLAGKPVTVTASVTSDYPTMTIPSGRVTWYADGAEIAPPTLTTDGTASFTTTTLSAGTHRLWANFEGGEGYGWSSGETYVTVAYPHACLTGNVPGFTVPAGDTVCVAAGARVSGPIVVESRGSLYVDRATVVGSVAAADAAVISLCGSTFRGDLRIERSRSLVEVGRSWSLGCEGNVATGLTLVGNRAGVDVTGNDIRGPVSIRDNVVDPFTGDRSVVVSGNWFRGRLDCIGNTPPPTDLGVRNTLSGRATGQCADLG